MRPYLVELLHLLDDLVVERYDIVAADVCAAVLLEKGELVPDGEDSVEDGLFARVEWCADGRRVGHGATVCDG